MVVKSLGVVAAALAAWACAQPESAAAAPLRSGMYEGLVLAVSPGGRVVGHFDMRQGEGVTKRCAFDFVGQASGNGATIRVTGAGLTGRLAASTPKEVSLSLPRMRTLPGCGLVVPPEVESPGGFEFDRVRPGSWSELARIGGGRVYLRPAPGGAAGRAYLVKGDVVGVLARRGNQVQVVYPSERARWAQGWVAAAELSAF